MPMHPFHRTELLVGGEGMARLRGARACVVGLGGVGSYAAEALVRAGVGHLTLVDFDRVCITNVNRQLLATRRTVGKFKVELMAERARAIHRKVDVRALPWFYCEEQADEILDPGYDVVLDCIDQMTAKLHLLEECVRREQPVVAAMGAGGRMDPTRVRVDDLSEVRVDPFARIVRKQLRKRGIETGIPCVWTDEPPQEQDATAEAEFQCVCPDKSLKERYSCESRYRIQGTVSWMPPIFGMTLGGVAVQRILGREVASPPQRKPRRRAPVREARAK